MINKIIKRITGKNKKEDEALKKETGGVTAFEQDVDESLPPPVQKVSAGDEDLVEED